MKKLTTDASYVLFGANEEESFEKTLKTMVSETVWERWKLSSCNVIGIAAGPLIAAATKNEFAFGDNVSTEAVVDTCSPASGSRYAMGYKGTDYLLSSTALSGFVSRIGADAPRLNRLPDDVKAKVLKYFAENIDSKATILFRNEKVRAVNGPDYVILNQSELFGALKDALNEQFPNWEFVSGYVSNDFSSASFTMPDQAEEILGTYYDQLEELGVTSKKMVPGLSFMTSDTGLSAVTVSVRLIDPENNRRTISVGSPIRLEHRGGASVAAFSSSLEDIFAQFRHQIDAISRLCDIEVDRPLSVAIAIAKKCGISKVCLRDAAETFCISDVSEERTTAHDVFFLLQEALYNMRCNGKFSRLGIFQAEENLTRCLNSNFKWEE